MGERWQTKCTARTRIADVRVVAVAERQWGLITRLQLGQCGLDPRGVERWISRGRLHRTLPGVYALGHGAIALEGRLAASLLYAGPGAMLSHGTAAWWWRLIPGRPASIHVSTPRRRRTIDGISVYRRRCIARTWHLELPVTPPAQTLLDVAAQAPFPRLRRALAEAEYLRLVTLDEVERVLGRGRPGSAALREALARHQPRLARTRSVLEERFLRLCESHSIAPPEVNARVAGLTVDALWRAQSVIVELDGVASHATPAGMEEDRGRDLRLRQAGYTVRRYTWQQVTGVPEAVARDLRTTLTCLGPKPLRTARTVPYSTG